MGSFEKGDRGARILKIQTLLQGNPRGLTTGEIARRTGVNPRTTYRDVRALEAMNVPIYEDRGRILIDPNYFIAPVKFTLREAMALLMGVRLMHRHADEADPDMADAFTKLAAVMPAPVAEYVHATVRQMAERPPNPAYSRILQTIALSWAGQKAVRIWYPSADHEVKPRVIEPYFLEPSLIGHGSYVVARDRGLGEMRTFKLERITRAEQSSDTYQIPGDFDISRYLAGAWGIFHSGEPVEVRLRFYPPAAARVKESIWHPSQRISEDKKGAVNLTVTVAGTVEITPWILGWGDAVEVVAPRELRDKIAAAGLKMSSRNSGLPNGKSVTKGKKPALAPS
ncbi:MAG: transcriptional regulator [Chloroflexi bacterium]|nr:MAG: transcriptional regulator [Chloroflexota bacterium]